MVLSEYVPIMSGHMKDITPFEREVHPVAQARAEIGLPREGLAFKAGVSVKTIERIEKGAVTPHRVTQAAIADVLGCQPSDLWPERKAA